ncbi:MAG: FAD-dependent oxidoreductase [Oscillatoriales cyanobacterium C42_A2020_001]|nr:FAD-dependent oxidoreductase [Leptolyngbyaceae cyanobacterium C42_A2020_001]
MQELTTDILVVGGGTGGTAAAIQAARRGANVILVSEFPWLGGMLTSAGVTAPDGNELAALQTGIWGAFLQELAKRQPEGLDHGWVSFFTYQAQVGAEIFADWVAELPNLKWISGQVPLEVLRAGDSNNDRDRVIGVRFADYIIRAQITLDGTELGDLLALGNIPHRWGWELQSEFGEPSAPTEPNQLTQTYPVQVPTWVVVMQDFGAGNEAPEIPPPPVETPSDRFANAWQNYGGEKFLNYGRLPGDRFMINWPIHGNDYGEGVERLVGSESERQAFLQESLWHTQSFARYIQTRLGRRYGLAADSFPTNQRSIGGGAYALHPYFRESRRLKGLTTIREQDLLPVPKGCVAQLPIAVSAEGCLNTENVCDAIAIGNYANDHHYPSGDIELAPKSIRWGGRWTGTPFTIPYRSLVSESVDSFLVCEKNFSVSHMANGATRLQPVILGVGQAAGMAAVLCVEQQCQPRALNVRSLQEALLTEPTAPAAVIPLFNLVPTDPQWLFWQRYYLDNPENYPCSGNCPTQHCTSNEEGLNSSDRLAQTLEGRFRHSSEQNYRLEITEPVHLMKQEMSLVTLCPFIHQTLLELPDNQAIQVAGRINRSGNWVLMTAIQPVP